MKKLAMLLTLALTLGVTVNAENIDGTLAVDGGNELINIQESTPNTLSAGLDDQESIKNTSEPISIPVATQSYYLEGPFVGFELNGVTASDADGISAGGFSYGLRFGAQNIDWRTMAVLEIFNNNGEANNYTRGIIQLDYFFLGQSLMQLDTYGIRPYAGLNAGLISLDTDTTNIKSLTYGAQIGASMNLTNNIDFDLSYRYNLSSSDRIDHTSGISAGLHYKY